MVFLKKHILIIYNSVLEILLFLIVSVYAMRSNSMLWIPSIKLCQLMGPWKSAFVNAISMQNGKFTNIYMENSTLFPGPLAKINGFHLGVCVCNYACHPGCDEF